MFLLKVNSIMSSLASCCIVKLPDEVCVSHTKRVGEIKKLYNYSSQSAAHQFIFYAEGDSESDFPVSVFRVN